MFDVILSPKGQDFSAAADTPLARTLGRGFSQLEQEPRRHNAIRVLTGPLAGIRRSRIGDRRVLFTIDDQRSKVLVLSIAHCGEVYE
jgi:mRNA-degrading endonuclease RelE of RelBE toxin-antitoxin system